LDKSVCIESKLKALLERLNLHNDPNSLLRGFVVKKSTGLLGFKL